jgi:hypothetical protein
MYEIKLRLLHWLYLSPNDHLAKLFDFFNRYISGVDITFYLLE